jgi:hypothetical protein
MNLYKKTSFNIIVYFSLLITVTERSKALTVFSRSNTGSWVRAPQAWMSVCFFCVCVVLCVGRRLATDTILPTVYRIRKLKKQPIPTEGSRAVDINHSK